MATEKLIKIVLNKLNEYFTSLGMQKQKEDIYIQEISENIISWIGLNKAVKQKGNYVEINVVIGVRHQGVEKLVADLREFKFHKYAPPTFSIHFGYITPNKCYSPLVFTPDVKIDKIIDVFKGEFENYGHKLLKENTTLENICNTLNNKRFLLPQQGEYRLAVCYFMQKQYNKATEYINQHLEKLKGKEDAFSNYMNIFSKNLFNLIEKENR